MTSYAVDANRQHAVVHPVAPCGHQDSETRSIRTSRGLVTFTMCPTCAAAWDSAWHWDRGRVVPGPMEAGS